MTSAGDRAAPPASSPPHDDVQCKNMDEAALRSVRIFNVNPSCLTTERGVFILLCCSQLYPHCISLLMSMYKLQAYPFLKVQTILQTPCDNTNSMVETSYIQASILTQLQNTHAAFNSSIPQSTPSYRSLLIPCIHAHTAVTQRLLQSDSPVTPWLCRIKHHQLSRRSSLR